MRKSIVLLLVSLILGLCGQGMAMQVAVSDNDRMGQSDLIAVGTIVSDTRIPDVDYWRAGQVVIKIDQILRGPKIDQITAIHAAPPIMPPGMIIMDHGGFNLTPGQKQIFFLQNGPDSFNFGFGYQGMQPVTDIEKYKNLIAMFPYKATLQTPIAPFYFGKPTDVTVTVKNTGADPIKLSPIMLEGKFYSPRMESYIQFEEARDDKQTMMLKMPDPVTVKPGEEGKVTAKFLTKKPASWQLFPADTYFQTPVLLRAKIYITIDTPVKTGQRQDGFYIASNWATVTIGFPLPDPNEDKTKTDKTTAETTPPVRIMAID
ncbi:MAG: hypothetical protein WCO98_11690 [bacterium]